MTEALAVITEDEQFNSQQPQSQLNNAAAMDKTKHPQGFPKNIERMFETFHQTPSGEFKPTFYNPFEIKHRRRTSRDQFQVLESAFMENSKPNATIRRTLAQKLGMTPRAVQVWFQNRRAKMKTGSGGSTPGCPLGQSELNNAGCESPHIGTTDGSTQCSSLASPDQTALLPKSVKVSKKGLGRRHSMPNIAQGGPPVITNDHFKQLHEAIFGGHMMTPQMSMQQQSMNYQVPMKPLPSGQSFDHASQCYPTAPSYYPPGYGLAPQHMHSPQVQSKARAASMAYGNPMMGMEASAADHQTGSAPSANDIDFFLQSIIIPQSAQAQQQQQQLFLSSLMQADPTQIPGLSENLTNFLSATNSNPSAGHCDPNGNQQQSDSYLLSKYMNDERFAD